MTIVYWPRGILEPRHCDANPASATVAGPAALSGFRQAVASPAGVWSITYEAIRVSGAGRLVWRALQAQIEGRATSIVVPIYDREELRANAATTAAVAPHSDGTLHSDGTAYGSRRSQFVVAAGVARGAVRATLTKVFGGTIAAGMNFSVGNRLYRVSAIEAPAGADTTVKFWPPAREAMLVGAEVQCDAPVCKVRLMRDDGLDVKLDHGRYSFPNVTFLEDPT